MSRALHEYVYYSTAQLRQFEEQARLSLHLSELDLMERAGRAAFNALQRHYPAVQTIAIFCGSGNNAGDAYVLARLAKESGLDVFVHEYVTIDKLPPAAAHAATLAQSRAINYRSIDEPIDEAVELLVDALFGIGLSSAVHAPLNAVIANMNASGLPIVSLDLPSGLEADTGRILGVSVVADITITFIGAKLGLYTLDGPDVSGKILCDTLGLDSLLTHEAAWVSLLDITILKKYLLARPKNSHKASFGSVLVIGGGLGMPGAAWLAAASSLNVGAGCVRIATHPQYATGFWANLPEAMVYPVVDACELDGLLALSTVCVVGPGLGESDWALALFERALQANIPLVLDASALRFLAKKPQKKADWVLTPHPGEAAALLGLSTEALQSNRYQSIRSIQHRYGGHIVLKGVGTLFATEHDTSICIDGNPGMAVAGMGDILTGMIAGLIAQGLPADTATALAVGLHARAGDDLAKTQGVRGLLAREILPYVRHLLNE